jgi:hypothetical protein
MSEMVTQTLNIAKGFMLSWCRDTLSISLTVLMEECFRRLLVSRDWLAEGSER